MASVKARVIRGLLSIAVCCLCLLAVSCASPSSRLYYADSPRLAQKLGLHESDWQQIEELIANERECCVLYVERTSLGLVAAWMATKDAAGFANRGPIIFYEKHHDRWYRLDEMSKWGNDPIK